MSGNLPLPDKFLPLLNDACDGTLTEAQIQELATVLDSDAAARKVFIDHISLQADIRFLGRAERLCDIGLAGVQAIVPQAASSSCPAPTPLSASSPTPSTARSAISPRVGRWRICWQR